MEDNDRFVDELLTAALSHQRTAEPRPGLEGRILECVGADRIAQSNSRKLWVVGPAVAAATAVMLVAIYLARRPQSPAPQSSQATHAVSAAPPGQTLKANSEQIPAIAPATTVIEPKRIARRERKSSRRVQAHHWPSQFPTPAPLTAEQKALVQYVRDTPPQVLSRPILKAEFTVLPVQIKPLEIPPLEIKPLPFGTTRHEIQ